MIKLEMKKTVFDGKIYHKAGQIVQVNNDVARHYLHKGFAHVVTEKVDSDEVNEEIENTEINDEVIETKEEKKVYKKRK